jgi:hypothetical protein
VSLRLSGVCYRIWPPRVVGPIRAEPERWHVVALCAAPHLRPRAAALAPQAAGAARGGRRVVAVVCKAALARRGVWAVALVAAVPVVQQKLVVVASSAIRGRLRRGCSSVRLRAIGHEAFKG